MQKIKKILSSLSFRVFAGLLAVYLAFSYFAVDPLAQRILPAFAEKNLASKLQVQRVQFDPLRLILTVDGLSLTAQDDSPLASFEQLYIDMETSGLFRWAWRFRDIRLTAPQVTLDIAPDGRLNWASLLEKLNEEEKEESSTIARVLIDHILIEHGNILYEERNRETPFRAVLQPLGLELDSLSTLPQDRGDYAILAELPEQGGRLKWKGNVGLNPLVSSGEMEIEDIKLAELMEIVRSEANPLNVTAGDLGARFNYSFALAKSDKGSFPQVEINQLAVALEHLAANHTTVSDAKSQIELEQLNLQLPTLSFSTEPSAKLDIQNVDLALQHFSFTHQNADLFRLEQAEVKGVSLDMAVNQLQIEEILLRKGVANIRRGVDGTVDWQQMAADFTNGTTSAQPAAGSSNSTSGTTPSPEWKYGIGRLALEETAVHIEDETTKTPVVLDLENLGVELQDFSQDMTKPVPLKAGFQVKQGGRLQLGGKLALSPMNADLQVKLTDLALKTFSPYINQTALLKLDQGALRLNGKLALDNAKSFKGQFRGGFGISRLVITEELTGLPFLAWKDLASKSLRYSLSPNRLHMDELRIVQPAGKFIIYEDGTMNVKRILRQQEAEPKQPVEPAKAADKDSLHVGIERVSIEGANLEFADLTLRPQFGTHINSLSGVINGLSSDPTTTAQVELDGKVDEFGSARIRGSVQPFQATDFTDLKLTFKNLEMNRLTPYSGKFAGRKIDSGRLSVDLEYKIKQRQLAGENRFVIHKLRLGERVESPDAMSLPLDLAIALLEDSDGLIDLDLPISGSLDDPQFSYGKIVWKALVNVLTKIVTSPFRALGKLLGSDSEELQDIGFDPGKTELAPPEQEKLKTIAQALIKRPSLSLNLKPVYDPIADKAALQEWATRRDVLEEMDIKLQEGEQPGPIDLTNPKAQSAVDRLLDSRITGKSSLKAVDAVKDYFRKAKPEDLPIYSEKLDQLRATVSVSEQELLQLAQLRATRVQDYLVKSSGLEADSVAIAKPSSAQGDGKLVQMHMELGVKPDARMPAAQPDSGQPPPPP